LCRLVSLNGKHPESQGAIKKSKIKQFQESWLDKNNILEND